MSAAQDEHLVVADDLYGLSSLPLPLCLTKDSLCVTIKEKVVMKCSDAKNTPSPTIRPAAFTANTRCRRKGINRLSAVCANGNVPNAAAASVADISATIY